VVASAVIVRDFSFLSVIDDSKKMTAAARTKAYEEILEKCRVGIGVADVPLIDRINIHQASLRAMEEAVANLRETPGCLLVDGRSQLQSSLTQFAIVDGDGLSFSVACASIVAKVTRDRMMDYYDDIYPEYGFRRHHGYGTEAHLEALRRHGPCKVHRKSFEPVKESWKPF
jgi:ribonuclease HII